MKKLLAFTAVALASSVVFAADKGTEFKFGGEIKQDFTMVNNVTLNTNAISVNSWHQKNQFHINAVSSDKLQAYFNLVHGTIWGGAGYNGGATVYSNTGAGAPASASATFAHTFEVAEAWMWWKVSDSFSVRPGRQAATYGEGFVVSRNDDLPLPYFFDGLMARWSMDFMDVDFGGAKVIDLGYQSANGNSDVDILMYGLNLGFKSLPDFLKKLDIFLLSAQGDASTGAVAGAAPLLAMPGLSTTNNGGSQTGSWNIMTYGLLGKIETSGWDFTVNAAFQSGKIKSTTTTVGDMTFGGNAMDFRLGYTFAEFMKARVFLGYHADSGQDKTATTVTSNNAYQPLWYDVAKYSAAGIWGMGNLTDIVAGIALNPSDETTVGVDLDIASRTTANDNATLIPAAQGNFFNPAANFTSANQYNSAAGNSNSNTSLGTVITAYAKHDYGHGFHMMANVQFLTLGNYYKPASATQAASSAYGLNLEAKYNF